ncbi:ECF transporter S component [Adlercreutzia mucosicola]|uniref:ECF transporter S component n=1 Tax=Adlercreutzia mucosicola TaxID=580026 RepID=UPI002B248190|nr:ECF transporter S component [Adlercreutzia mucosicola]MEB1814703.1 ECF transporter S component [Adlercreutzia mucosicola]
MADKPTIHPADVASPVRPAKAPTAQKTLANTNVWSTRVLVTIALMCAVSILLTFVEFPLLPGVAWLSYDASFMPAMVCGFAYGPAAGLACGVISVVAHGILFADFTGALMNFLVVIGYILPAALVYQRIHNIKGAVIGLVLGIVVAVAMAVAGNLLVTPAWLGVPLDAVVAMIVPILIPFNLLKGILNSVLTLVVYKAISNLITPKKDQVKGL